MGDYHIRPYKDSDFHAVRDIIARSITEHHTVALRHALSLPRVWCLILTVFLLALLTTGSSVISSIAGASVILLLWLNIINIFTTYVRRTLAGDMLDIQKFYFQQDFCCFWVAESAEEIVGTVAFTPYPNSGGQKQAELKRLSVSKKHRRKGIGKALCKTMIDFARKAGYEGIVLQTSTFRVSAIRLYEKMGFQKTKTFHPNYPFTRFIDFVEIIFQYNLPKQE